MVQNPESRPRREMGAGSELGSLTRSWGEESQHKPQIAMWTLASHSPSSGLGFSSIQYREPHSLHVILPWKLTIDIILIPISQMKKVRLRGEGLTQGHSLMWNQAWSSDLSLSPRAPGLLP